MQKKVSRLINYLILLIIAGGVVYMCNLSPDAQIKVNGEKTYPRNKKSYEEGVNKQLKSSIFYRNKITFDSASVSEKIKEAFPEVNSVNIKVSPFRHRPVIELSLAKPAERLVSGNKSYILDEDGTVLFDQNDASSTLDIGSLLTISDDSGQSVEFGKPALSGIQISFIKEVIGQTKAKGLEAQSFTLSRGGTELDVRFKGWNYFVKFSFASDARQSSGALIALQEQLKKDGTAPSQYIDLRIPDKAFVK